MCEQRYEEKLQEGGGGGGGEQEERAKAKTESCCARRSSLRMRFTHDLMKVPHEASVMMKATGDGGSMSAFVGDGRYTCDKRHGS